MKKHVLKKALFAALLMPLLAGCAQEDVLILKALNCEDYIGEDEFEFTYEDENGEEVTVSYDDVLAGFEKYESAKLGRTVHVVYDNYDTNETMLSSLRTGKTSYDLICASDYAIQKMMTMGILQKINLENVPNYTAYCSPTLFSIMDGITAKVDDVEEKMSDYSVGYMWGTLGILYNPAKVAADKKLDEDEVKFDMSSSWTNLWDSKYRSMMSIKDSMRDTYSVGIMKEFDEEIRALMTDSGCFDMEDASYPLLPEFYEEADTVYNAALTEIFNRCDEASVAKVKEELLALKEIVFGFEVDSGKDDMVKGLVGMNLAWSGDAVYSMDRGDNEAGNTIYYSVPSTGGNIWFDSWCIPKTSDAEHKALAEDFLNFISDPQVAAANMSTIGYTSFIAGDTVHDLVRLWYDPRAYSMFIYHDATRDGDAYTWEDSDFVSQEYDEEGNPLDTDHEYDEDHDIAYQSGIVLGDGEGEYNASNIADFDFEEGILDMAGSTFDAPVVEGVEMTWDEYIAAYDAKAEAVNAVIAEYNETVSEKDQLGELEAIEGWDIRNLTYMFEGSLDLSQGVYDLDSEDPALNPYIFYTDEIEEVTVGEQSVYCYRQFGAQYPDHNIIPKLAVMRDYGSNNQYVLAMWSEVKSNNLPVVAVILFSILLAAAAALIISYLIIKRYHHSFQVKRRKETVAELEAKAAKANKK